MTEAEEKKILDEAMKELDEMLAEHEKFKEEYGKKYANLSPEEQKKLYIEELEQTYDFLVHSGMKVDKIEVENE